jgi:ABC-type dipeptide/oligopeptide/nickel transport system ATPase subunit
MPAMQFDQFTVALLLLRPDAPQLDETEEAALQDAHMAHLADLHAAGHLLAAGPLRGGPDDRYRGLSILNVDPERARALKEGDPAVRAGRYSVVVLPWLAGVAETEMAERTRDALAMVGLADRSAHTTAELSGGEQQRVAVARALAKRPTVVIADEPTAQLDSETAAGVMALLREVAASGTAVLMATRDRVAIDFADRVVTA